MRLVRWSTVVNGGMGHGYAEGEREMPSSLWAEIMLHGMSSYEVLNCELAEESKARHIPDSGRTNTGTQLDRVRQAKPITAETWEQYYRNEAEPSEPMVQEQVESSSSNDRDGRDVLTDSQDREIPFIEVDYT